MLDYIVIGMVFNEAMTGYDIKKEVEAGIGNFYRASYGSLYPALKRLTDKGLLAMTEQAQGGRVKKYYMATEQGRADFLEWLASPMHLAAVGEALLARIYFFGELPKDIRDRQLLDCEMQCRQMLRHLQEIEKNLDKCYAAKAIGDRDYYGMSTLYLGLLNVQTTIHWLAHIREQKPLAEFIDNHKEN